MAALATLSTLVALALLVGSSVAKQPNILYILSDDVGWNEVSWHNPDMITPNLQELADEGVVLEHHYTNSLCTPSRSALMTGIFPPLFSFSLPPFSLLYFLYHLLSPIPRSIDITVPYCLIPSFPFPPLYNILINFLPSQLFSFFSSLYPIYQYSPLHIFLPYFFPSSLSSSPFSFFLLSIPFIYHFSPSSPFPFPSLFDIASLFLPLLHFSYLLFTSSPLPFLLLFKYSSPISSPFFLFPPLYTLHLSLIPLFPFLLSL
ncbi:hypothetical protein C7M84_014068 [Penaeus vannamei]|uniref:Sulfatase N-terminal domain-containing protein n=1 Tax=Penaeus vannamei TaxID=6689 RepID=A0A423SUG1_PENVA|nr:hypothetical protein C7M84_014068 [Penaeus vannamei]